MNIDRQLLLSLAGGDADLTGQGRSCPGSGRGWTEVVVGQVAGLGSAASLVNAPSRSAAHGQPSAMRSRVRRAERVIRAATCSSR